MTQCFVYKGFYKNFRMLRITCNTEFWLEWILPLFQYFKQGALEKIWFRMAFTLVSVV